MYTAKEEALEREHDVLAGQKTKQNKNLTIVYSEPHKILKCFR